MAGEQQTPPAAFGTGNGSDAANRARAAAGEFSEAARGQAEAGKNQAADSLGRTTDAMRNAARQLQDQVPWMASLVDRGADELSRVADTLRNNDLRSLLHDMEGFARRQPALFASASFALGFAAVRAARAGMAASTDRPAGDPGERWRDAQYGPGAGRAGAGFQSDQAPPGSWQASGAAGGGEDGGIGIPPGPGAGKRGDSHDD